MSQKNKSNSMSQTDKANKMKKVILPVSAVLAMGLSLVLTACGGLQQDPLEKYPLTSASRPIENPDDLKKVIPEPKKVIVIQKEAVDRPVYYPQEVEQNYAAAQLFQITTNQAISFVTGVESKVPFEVRVLQGKADFSASVSGLEGATLTEVAVDGNKKSYILVYKPSVDSIPGASREKAGTLQVSLDLKSITADTEYKQKRLDQAFAAVSKARPFDFTIRRNYNNPKLEIAGFPASIQEGGKQSFSIKVSAPGTYKDYEPVMHVTYDYKGLGGGLFENSGTPFIRPAANRIVDNGNGEWTFNYELDTNLFAVPAQLDKNMKKVEAASEVRLRVSFQAISPTGATSDERVMQYKIVYNKSTAPVSEAVATPQATEVKK